MLSHIPRVYWATAIITMVVAFYIYSTIKQNRARSPSRHSIQLFGGHNFNVPLSRFAGVETLRTVSSKELIAEIEKVIAQHGLPADVFFGLSINVSEEERERQQELQEHNIAVTLHLAFREYYEIDPSDPDTLPSDDLEQLWEASPIGVWDIDEAALNSVRATLAHFEERRQTIRHELDNIAQTQFYYMFNRPESVKSFTYRETMVNTGASKYLADYALLEEYAVAQALLEGNIREALNALVYIFRITCSASRLQDVGVRADAAHVRLRAFDVMQRIVLDPQFEKQHMVFLRNMLLEQHKYWTSEHLAWFGDRAGGLKFYHHITLDGLNALESEELEVLERRNMVDTFQRNFRFNREADMTFYLQAMQRIINISKRPLIQRREVINQINRERLAKMNTYDKETGAALEPFVANFRLSDVDDFMHLFAQDQSALHRALAAILRSLGEGNTELYRDPYTEMPYVMRRVDGLISVSATMLPHPFRVPVFTEESPPAASEYTKVIPNANMLEG